MGEGNECKHHDEVSGCKVVLLWGVVAPLMVILFGSLFREREYLPSSSSFSFFLFLFFFLSQLFNLVFAYDLMHWGCILPRIFERSLPVVVGYNWKCGLFQPLFFFLFYYYSTLLQ